MLAEQGKPSIDESGQEKRPNTLYQQVFASSCISLFCPSSPELIFEAHEHSTVRRYEDCQNYENRDSVADNATPANCQKDGR